MDVNENKPTTPAAPATPATPATPGNPATPKNPAADTAETNNASANAPVVVNMAASAQGPASENAQAAPAPAPPSMADRLAEVRVGLRGDLQVTRHLFRGEPSYIIRDPISFDTHRLSPTDYQILICIRADQPLSNIFQQLVKQGKLTADDKDAFYGFIVELHRSGFLSLPIVDAATLNRRRLLKRQARLKQLILSPVFMKLPGLNPDAFLERTVGRVSWIFSKGFFIFWLCLMSFAGFTLLRNFDRLSEPLNTVMVVGNLPLLWLTLIGLKVFHEFGHAYACKVFGGRVPEMGVFLIALTPCAFVDASDSWSFTSRRARLIVCLAGMYVELTIAAIAIILWSLTGPSVLNSLAFNIALLSSVLTILFNINPLMRYDGYYAFSDMVEVPNLREKSRATMASLVRKLVIGDVQHSEHEYSFGMRVFLFCFGVASSLYKITVVMGISIMIATKLFLPGLALGAMYLGNQLFTSARAMVRMLLSVTEPAARVRAAVAAAVIFAVMPAVLFLVPLPDSIQAEAVIAASSEREVFAPFEGFVEEVLIEPGQIVDSGEKLLRISNSQVEQDYINASADRQITAIRTKAAMSLSPVETEISRREASSAESHYAQIARQRDRQIITSPLQGQVLSCIDQSLVGGFVVPGQPVATIGAKGWKLKFALNADQITRLDPKPGDLVEFRSSHLDIFDSTARITRVSAGGDRHIDSPELTHLAEGEIPVDPQTFQAQRPYYMVEAQLESASENVMCGMTGSVRMKSQAKTVVSRLSAKFKRFLFNLRQ